MMIGLAGVTSTGKTTMAAAIKERYGDRVIILNKISRKEIFEFAGLDSSENDLTKRSNEDRMKFDVARISLQIKKEEELIDESSKRPVIIDGCAIVKVAYMLYLSAPYVAQHYGESKLTEIVEKALIHIDYCYDRIFYLPVTRIPFKEADHRVFKNKYIRTSQDAILNRLLTTESDIKINRFDSTDMNLVFDELSKMGV